MDNYFPTELQTIIKSLLNRYETRRSSVIPILHAIQDWHDWVSASDIELLEQHYNLPTVDTYEVLTFYSMFRTNPPKPYRFEVCNSISCWLQGAEDTLLALKNHINAAKLKGKPLPFEVHEVECLGMCGKGPVAFVNKERFLRVKPEVALQIVEEYLKAELPLAAINCQNSQQGI